MSDNAQSRHPSRSGRSSRRASRPPATASASGGSAQRRSNQSNTSNNENRQETPPIPLPPRIPHAQQEAMAYSGIGFNPRWGPDLGLPPHLAQRPGMGYPMMMPGGAYMYPQQHGPVMQHYGGGYGGGYGYGGIMNTPVMTVGGGVMTHSMMSPMAGGGGPRPIITPGGRPQYPYPVINSDSPSANMTNSTGGVGCEPGYNYFFPPEHTKIHFLKTGSTPPWHLKPGTNIEFHATHVPTNITIGELLKGFGANNPNPQLNNVTECIAGANGVWYKGMGFSGDVRDDMARTLKSVGWDATRTGLPSGNPVVYLYITKD